ncbi:MAG: hypothetical protein HRT38_10740, partial [Alteromonadaceae bacterium]|nr:hypothetical protein [Alteromonadaceae bacterium]
MAVFSTIRRNCTTQNLNILPDITYQDSNNSNTKLRLTSAAILSLAMHGSAFADHSEVPAGVALVGSLQSEIGCSSDWQPECVASELQLNELSQNGDEWQATFLIPPGSWEYKVALNDNWDESYGDNGNNVALFLLEETAVTFTYNHANHEVSSNAPVIVVQPNSVALVGDLQDELVPERKPLKVLLHMLFELFLKTKIL